MKEALLTLTLAVCAMSAPLMPETKTGTIEDMEHIVIFMQENRAFDHYYGSLRGVRGFNDPAAPLLPSGKPVWYQPVGNASTNTSLCGCGTCDLHWLESHSELQSLLTGMRCSLFANLLSNAEPSVPISQGELCSTLISAMLGSTIQHMKVNESLASNSTCPPDLKVSELGNDQDNLVPDDEYMLPFHIAFDNTSATCMGAPAMGYQPDIQMWNSGRMDGWNTAREPGFGMSYFERSDLPFYYALADAFTIGDQYFQSTFTATDPNRLHLFSGSNGLSVNSSYCILDDSEPGVNWETMGETLEKAGVSWKVYQETDNFDDNAFAWFDAYREAKPGSALYDKGMARVPTGELVNAFAKDVTNDALPSVSIIIAPTWRSEHAENHPQDGEDLSAQLVEVLARPENQAVYAKTAFIINYDEGGQFFDHHWTPTPPSSPADGKSTVSVVGEITTKEEQGLAAPLPIGLGFRVPLFIVSPWTRGAYTYSEVADHTSVIKLIEKRFKVTCPNISPWRRAVVGDLTAAFDFTSVDMSWPTFPSTAGNVNASKYECKNLPAPVVPKTQWLPKQEEGTRMQRPLPYVFDISDKHAEGSEVITVTIDNVGTQGAVLMMTDRVSVTARPRKYTVEASKSLADDFSLFQGQYSLSLHGPNGFVRTFVGSSATAGLNAGLAYDVSAQRVWVTVSGAGCSFIVTPSALSGQAAWTSEVLRDGETVTHAIEVNVTANWYDVTVTAPSCGGGSFVRRMMGKMETGQTTTTDPAMAVSPPITHEKHPDVPEVYRHVRAWNSDVDCKKRRSWSKDHCGMHRNKAAHKEEL